MDQKFYNLLYNGYTGEFQLMGALYRNGLDALRPLADMGVDVVTVNLKAQLQDPSVQPETLMFQVKTAVVTVQKAGEGMRGYTTVYFMLKESEVDMLCAARTRALAKDASEKKLETASEKAAGTKPVAVKSVDVKSDAAQSSVAQPAGSESGAAQSASAQSVGSKHDAGRPVGTKPFVVQIVGVGSDVARPNAAQPVSVQPSVEESAPAKLACERPDAARPTDAGQTDEGAAEVELPW